MAKKSSKDEVSLPVLGMVVVGVSGAIVTAASCEVIKYWPLPVSVTPYFGWQEGLSWGLIVGALVGLVIGYLMDEEHFNEQSYE